MKKIEIHENKMGQRLLKENPKCFSPLSLCTGYSLRNSLAFILLID